MAGSRNPNLGLVNSSPVGIAGEEWRRNLGSNKVHLGMPRSSDWWTGLAPDNCPGYGVDGKLHSLNIPNLATCSRQEALDYFKNGWTLSELLFSSLIGEEAFYRPPYHGLRHPLIFYYVHPAVLYVNKMRIAGLRETSANSYFESLFETGVDEMSWDDMSKNAIEWPSIDDALSYRKRVYAAVVELINSHPDLSEGHAPIMQDHPLWALFMGFEHERIHLETSSVLMRELPVHLLTRPQQWPSMSPIIQTDASIAPVLGRDYPENGFVPIAADSVSYGKPLDWPIYGWDNEYGNRSCRLSEFQASSFLISNGEFWQFVAEGGYREKEFWTETGWKWRSYTNAKAPCFWVPDGPQGSNQFRLRTCFEIVPMQWSWPAVVNFHEAKAFCRWKEKKEQKNLRLITEAEHQALRQASKFDNKSKHDLLPPDPFNTNLRMGSESPVDEAVSGELPIFDLFGNVWQWCEDHFNPLSGSRVHPFYDDFSTPCYDGEHQMIMGGSFISTGDEASPWARYHFRPHFFQHAGFRIVHSPDGSDGAVAKLGGETLTGAMYEQEDIFNEYMTLHYGAKHLQMPHEFGPEGAVQFPQRCADLIIDWCTKLGLPTDRALDIGCAVGGSSFRLAETFDEVIGIDLSERFIDAAKQLKKNHELSFNYKIEGNIFGQAKAVVSSELAEHVDFRRADACSLPAEYVDFDAVLMANLLCRLPSPKACLTRIWGNRGVLRPGGLLVIVSPYSWMEKFSPKDVWLGGYSDAKGNKCLSEDGIKQLLSPHFELLEIKDLPLVIREHARKFQYIVSQAMVWRRL